MRLKSWLGVELLVLVAVWQLVAQLLRAPFVPTPIEVLHSFVTELPHSLAYHLAISGWRVLVSNLIAMLISLPLAYLTAQSHLIDQLLTPLANFIYPVPKIVFLPLVLLLFGVGNSAKVVLLVFVISFQMFVIVRDAIHSVRAETLDSVRSLGASRWHLVRYVYVPATIPATLTALKVSTGTAIAVLFIAESFATRTGLGYYIMVETWGRMAYPQMYAGVLAMGLLGLSFYLALVRLERYLCPWLNEPTG